MKTIHVDVRIVAATHRDLENMIERQQFRLDLFYRLNVVPLWLPPLRARRDDIELLARHFCQTIAVANGKPPITLDDGAVRFLRSQRWPGNVRQLQNFVERLVVLATESVIREQHVKNELGQTTFKTQTGTAEAYDKTEHAVTVAAAGPASGGLDLMTLDGEMKAAERRALERALLHCQGNRSSAARLLAVSRSTLYAKLRDHGLL
jgi:two-component system response regulator AtoC